MARDQRPPFCTAKTANGSMCTRRSVAGDTVCTAHGGVSPMHMGAEQTHAQQAKLDLAPVTGEMAHAAARQVALAARDADERREFLDALDLHYSQDTGEWFFGRAVSPSVGFGHPKW